MSHVFAIMEQKWPRNVDYKYVHICTTLINRWVAAMLTWRAGSQMQWISWENITSISPGKFTALYFILRALQKLMWGQSLWTGRRTTHQWMLRTNLHFSGWSYMIDWLIGQSLTSQQHASDYMRRPYKGHEKGCFKAPPPEAQHRSVTIVFSIPSAILQVQSHIASMVSARVCLFEHAIY